MNVLVTGSAGFLGRNLVENLRCICKGKNMTRPNLHIDAIYEYDRDTTIDQLEEYCKNADFIFHCAGVNRPKEDSEFMEGNLGFTLDLLDILKKHNNLAPIVITSSVQATLTGRFCNSEYGRSKLAGEKLMFSYAAETGASVYVYRLPNLVGKWGRASYNSAVITFCHHIARNMPIRVSDSSVELDLLFVDDLCEEFYNAMEGKPCHCEFPGKGEIFDGVEYDGVTPRWTEVGLYCGCPITYKATLGEITTLLYKFHEQSNTLFIPTLTPGSLEKKLYAVYLSYLPADKIIYDMPMAIDNRGSFTENLKTVNAGQLSINISNPGYTKGEHWHNHKSEIFIVVSGHGLIKERKIGTDEVVEFEVSGEKIQAVQMLPGWTHNIMNLSDTEPMVTLIWANEIFDRSRPDTYGENVVQTNSTC